MKMKSLFAKILCSAVALAIVCGSVFTGAPLLAKADETTKPAQKFFTVDGKDYTAEYVIVEGDNNDLLRFSPEEKATEKDGKWVVDGAFKNKVAINDLAMSLKLSSNLSSVEFTLVTAPYIASGNPYVDDKGTADTADDVDAVAKEVENSVKFVNNGSNFKVVANGQDTPYTVDTNLFLLKTSVADGALTLNIAGNALTESRTEKLVECQDKTMATIKVKFEYASEPTATDAGVSFEYIDQAVSATTNGNDALKQAFEVDANGALKNTKGFVIDLNAESTGCKIEGNKLTLIKNVNYTIKYDYYRLNGGGTPVVKLITKDTATEEACAVNNEDKKITFVKKGTGYNIAINDNAKDLATYTVDVVDADKLYSDGYATEQAYKTAVYNNAPEYINDADALKSFQVAVNDASQTEYDGVKKSIRVGSGKYLNLPSMANLVSDDVNGYGALDATVYYMNINTDNAWSTNSGLKVPVKKAGEYKFFVVFADDYGNAIDAEKNEYNETSGKYFYEKGDNDEITINPDYEKYVFSFEVKDDAPISVSAGNNSNWYTGVKNTASSFSIEASDDRVVTYKLEYEAGANDWKEIKTYANDYDDYGYFTAEEIQAIAYDGTLTFTPNKAGKYKITCSVTQTNGVAGASAETIITVNDVATVEPYDFWFENNVWSFVFLGIGTLALAGVIVLLCIKPKEDK